MNKNKSTYNLIFVFVLMFSNLQSFTQEDFQWWNEAHNWDGNTHWTNYIISSPYYLGPNAIPVPHSEKGLIKQQIELKTEYYSHFGKGDNTQNILLSLYIPLAKNRVAIEFYGVPFESYKMNYGTVLERRVRYQDGKGTAIGDFYFSTIIQVLKKESLPDIAVRFACRTASGNKLGYARYTDASGYFFDLSFGKDFTLTQNKDLTVRPHGMFGFYSWQMNLPDNKQNDAILFGFGADISYKSWYLNTAVEGYSGYFGEELVIVGDKENPVVFKDRPMLYRLEAGKKIEWIRISLGYQLPLHHFQYNYFKASLGFYF